MVKLLIKNLKEIENDTHREQFETQCSENSDYLNDLFKNYDKDLTFEVLINKSGKTYRVSCSLNLLSKTVKQIEEDKDILVASTRLFNRFKKEVKKQKELEKKDYLYKRKR